MPLATPNAPVKMASNDSVDFVLSWKTFGSTENWDQMSNKLFTMVRLPWALDCCLSLLQPQEDLEIFLKVSMFALSKLEYPILFRLRIADPVGPQSSCPMGSWAPRHFHRPCPASSQAQPRLEPTWKLRYCALAPERKRWISSSPVTSPWSLRVCSWGGIGTVIKSFFFIVIMFGKTTVTISVWALREENFTCRSSRRIVFGLLQWPPKLTFLRYSDVGNWLISSA